jgi:hypothetical protein
MRTFGILGIVAIMASGSAGCGAAEEDVGTVQAALHVSEDRIVFGEVPAGCETTLAVRITNEGSSTVTFDSITSTDPDHIIPCILPGELREAEWYDLDIKFAPDNDVPFQADITIESSDPNIVIHAEGTGTPPSGCDP